MQDHIDLDSQSKKHSRSNFWSAASVLGKKLQNWRRKRKKSDGNGNGVVSSSTLPVEKPNSRQYREKKSETADYGFGRRSCDFDPRFSLDPGRISFDAPRHSYDNPRASWDGYVIGRTFPRLPPMAVPAPRSDTQISVEQPVNTDDFFIPGGSIQTREYYTDSSSRRRKSLDRSNSIRKMAEMEEKEETKATVSNAKVSPATIDCKSYGRLGLRFASIGGELELSRDSNSASLRDDCSETFEFGKTEGKKQKPKRWRWKLWGFVHRNSEPWEESGMNNRLFRSNSTVSWRDSEFNTKKSKFEIKSRRIGGDECVLERNRSSISRNM
ncbi:hypothetical protein SSX86_026049 [Deinandra increscens subsp. villosa]|uniref:Uncharacterized protein n=1 Tax=Deinandra increscens subsp. villosa TaxID=3103831 RepID=A0AAP0CED6_9ASTR